MRFKDTQRQESVERMMVSEALVWSLVEGHKVSMKQQLPVVQQIQM